LQSPFRTEEGLVPEATLKDPFRTEELLPEAVLLDPFRTEE
jgi:hypothetical protein